MNTLLNRIDNRRLIGRWATGALVLLIIAVGWRFPQVGLAVPVVMVTGLAGGLFRGRYVCGNLCPRGHFLSSWFAPFAGGRAVPGWLRSKPTRAVILVALMGFLFWQLSLDPTSLAHWGRVFWQMCLLTTLAAVALGLAYRERAWCTICPMGSLQAAESRGRYPLLVDDQCRRCRLCEPDCPMEIPLVARFDNGRMEHPDCIKCSNCVQSCPAKALSWPKS